MEAHTKVDLACIVKPHTDVVWKVWLLGINPRSSTFSPFFLLLSLLFPGPSLFSSLFPFILAFNSLSSPTCQFFRVWGNYSSYQSSRRSGWEKLDSIVWGMGLSDVGLYVMVLAAFSLVLLLYWVCPFLQAFCEALSVRLSSATFLGLQGAFIARPRQ